MQTLLDGSTPEPDLGQLRLALDEVIVQLREDEREAIALRFFEKRTFAEIGEVLHLSEDAARKRLDRALEKLRLTLSRLGITSTSVALSTALAVLCTTSGPVGLASKIAGGALAHAASVGALSTLTTMITPSAIIAGAALVLGGWALVEQHATNRKLAAELTGSDQTNAIAGLRVENARLAVEVTEAEARARTLTGAEAQSIASAQAVNASESSRITKTVSVTDKGTLLWGTDPVRLEEFVTLLKGMKSSSAQDTAVVISSAGNFPQMAYVIDQARKAGVTHVSVNSGPSVEATFTPGWF